MEENKNDVVKLELTKNELGDVALILADAVTKIQEEGTCSPERIEELSALVRKMLKVLLDVL